MTERRANAKDIPENALEFWSMLEVQGGREELQLTPKFLALVPGEPRECLDFVLGNAHTSWRLGNAHTSWRLNQL